MMANSFTRFRSSARIAPDLAGSLPRQARYAFGPLLARLAGFLVWCLVTVWLASFGKQDLDELFALRDHGATVTAQMCYSYDRYGKQVTYCRNGLYLAGSHAFEQGGSFSIRDHALVLLEDTVITYLPSHPETVRPGPVTPQNVNTALLLWVGGIGLGSAAAALLVNCCLWGHTKQMRILTQGEAVEAVVTAIGYSTVMLRPVYAVFYTYSVGEEQHIHACRISKKLFGRFEQSMKIMVLHLPGNPPISMPFVAITAARLL
jgi:hypothetical protein